MLNYIIILFGLIRTAEFLELSYFRIKCSGFAEYFALFPLCCYPLHNLTLLLPPEEKLLIETVYKLHCPKAFAFLSDAHNTDPSEILASLQRNSPEFIVMSGDFVYKEKAEKTQLKMEESPDALELMRGCSRIAPTFVSLGNHERLLSDADLRIVKETGVTLLDNRWTEYDGIFIGGLSSAYFTACRYLFADRSVPAHYPGVLSYLFKAPPVPELSWLDEFEKLQGFKLLLCHHPEYYPKYLRERNIDLVCSGHCHGGQWRYYSFIRKTMQGVWAPNQGFFPQLTEGIHEGRLLISRGLSNPTIIPRINNPPELIYCRVSD